MITVVLTQLIRYYVIQECLPFLFLHINSQLNTHKHEYERYINDFCGQVFLHVPGL